MNTDYKIQYDSYADIIEINGENNSITVELHEKYTYRFIRSMCGFKDFGDYLFLQIGNGKNSEAGERAGSADIIYIPFSVSKEKVKENSNIGLKSDLEVFHLYFHDFDDTTVPLEKSILCRSKNDNYPDPTPSFDFSISATKKYITITNCGSIIVPVETEGDNIKKSYKLRTHDELYIKNFACSLMGSYNKTANRIVKVLYTRYIEWLDNGKNRNMEDDMHMRYVANLTNGKIKYILSEYPVLISKSIPTITPFDLVLDEFTKNKMSLDLLSLSLYDYDIFNQSAVNGEIHFLNYLNRLKEIKNNKMIATYDYEKIDYEDDTVF